MAATDDQPFSRIDPNFSIDRAKRYLPPSAPVTLKGFGELRRLGQARLQQLNEAIELCGVGVSPGDLVGASDLAKLEKRVRSLELVGTSDGKAAGQWGDEGRYSLAAGTSATGSKESVVWDHLQARYDSMLSYLADESIRDTLKIAAAECYDSTMLRWGRELEEFSSEIEARAREYKSMGQSAGGSLTRSREPRAWRDDRGAGEVAQLESEAEHVLLLRYTAAPEWPRRAEDVEELKALSLSVVPAEAQASCGEVWDIVIGLCGLGGKQEGGPDKLRLVVINSVRALEEFCEFAIVEELRHRRASTLQMEETALEQLQEFCNREGSRTFPSTQSHFWSLAYHAFRSGHIDVLDELAAVGQQTLSIDCDVPPHYSVLCRLLAMRLAETTSSLQARMDDPRDHNAVNLRGCEYASRVAHAETTYAQHMQEIRLTWPTYSDMHPTAAVLLSLIDAEKGAARLQQYLPAASAEDYIWYDLHSALLRSTSPKGLVEQLTTLQNLIRTKGPDHFYSHASTGTTRVDVGSSAARVMWGRAEEEAAWDTIGTPEAVDLNYAKVLLYALDASAAIEWAHEAYPSLRRICVHWLLYLRRQGLLGTTEWPGSSARSRGLLTMHTESSDSLGHFELGGCCANLLAECPLTVKLPFLKTLSVEERASFLAILVEQHFEEMLSEDLLGRVKSEGEVEHGTLLALLDSPPLPLKARADIQAWQTQMFGMYRQVCCQLGGAAADAKLLTVALRCFILADCESDALRLLLCAFHDVKVTFSPFRPLDAVSKAGQQELLAFCRFFKSREDAKAPTGADSILWEQVKQGVEIAKAYNLTRENRLQEAMTHMEKLRLVPYDEDLAQWRASEFCDHVPLLLDAYVFCLYETYRRGVLTYESPGILRQKLHRLLNVINQLWDSRASPSTQTRQYLRDLLMAVES